MHYYYIYGLNLASTIAFPEAEEIPPCTSPDAEIILSTPPEWVMEEYRQGKFSSISEDIMWFRLNDELLIYVEHGRKALIWKIFQELDDVRMRTYILSGAITFLLFQRHFLLIHGSALYHNGKAYLVSGASGSGKSTTALSLLKLPGVQFASDDICATRIHGNECILHPGPPWQKVCEDVQRLDTCHEYTYIEEIGTKYGRKLSDRFVSVPVPIGGMFIISREDCPQLLTRQLLGGEKLKALTCNLFRGELLNLLGITPDRMAQFVATANCFPMWLISRSVNADTLAEVTDFIYHTFSGK